MAQLRFSDLSASRQAFIRQCQQIGFGSVRALAVRDGEPVFGPTAEVLFDVKLDTDESPRPEQDLHDFILSAEIVRMFSKLDAIGNGTIEHVEVRGGVPRRIIVRASDPMSR
jgi:hypothetical protein